MHSATWENTTSLLIFLSLITNGHIASMPQSNNMEREKGGYGQKQYKSIYCRLNMILKKIKAHFFSTEFLIKCYIFINNHILA